MRRWKWLVAAGLIVGVLVLSSAPGTSASRASRELRKLGAEITRDETKPGKPVVGVDLADVEVKADDLEHLRSLPDLERLNLSRCPVTDEGMAHLAGLPALKVLNLSGTQVTNAGLDHLQGLPQLEDLRLSRTRITDAGLAHLQGLSQLRALNISFTETSPAAVAALRKALPECKIVRR